MTGLSDTVFLRLRCGDCGHDKLVAFSCKRRGFCPSCGARRMAQTAGAPGGPRHSPCAGAPVGTVTADPAAPAAGRAANLVTPVLQVVHRVITRFLLDQAIKRT
jgi:hypothetical protein